jgi:hypothetical protein
MTALATLETRLRAAWKDLSTDIPAEVEVAVTDAKAEAAQFKPLLKTFETDLKTAVAAAEPGIKTDVETILAKLLADAAKIGVADLGV